MNTSRITVYESKLAKYNNEFIEVKKQHAAVSIARLTVFVLFLLSWFWVFPSVNRAIGVVLGILMFVVFLVLLKVHKKLDDKRSYLESIIAINKNERDCCNGKFSAFNGGAEFTDSNHPYSYDIDLFGNGSLFQYINRTITPAGKKVLAKWLSETPLGKKTIRLNQIAVKELSPLVDFRQEFQTIGKLHHSNDDEDKLIGRWLSRPSFFGNKIFTQIMLWLIPAINLGLLFLMIIGQVNWSVLTFIIVINLMIIGSRLKKFNQVYNLLSKSHVNLKKMCKLFGLLENQKFESKLLCTLQNSFFKEKQSASEQINRLTKLLDGLDNRNNILLAFVLNSFLLWDWQYLWRIEKWQKSHQLDYKDWQKSVATFDALLSLSNMAFNNPDFTYPKIVERGYSFKAYGIGHPLLLKTIRICNDIEIEQSPRYVIVTGANMAGKSTFLRTIAINLVLAGCGSAVCAKKMELLPLPLHSSMRAEDSLMKNESYFFAELKRLQRITKELEGGKKLFIILDEILRGTNSEDKRKGSIGFVNKITAQSAFGLVATHDLELARLAEQKPDVFKALCFEVGFKNNELQFDYKLQPGITKNMNASFLMKRMGIIE